MMNKLQLLSLKGDVMYSLNAVSERLGIELKSDIAKPIGDVLWPNEEWVGVFEDIIFITTDAIDEFFFEPTEFVRRFLKSYPAAKICATHYYSVIDQLGFSYFENGERKRSWYGEEEEAYVDFGERLALEDLDCSLFPDGRIEYQLIEEVIGCSFSDILRQEVLMFPFERRQSSREGSSSIEVEI